MIIPDLTIRESISPYDEILYLNYYQTKNPTGSILPVKENETSNLFSFRIYNNWALNSGIADAGNVHITTYDGSPAYTGSTNPVSQTWIHFYETGFGQSSSTPAVYTQFLGFDTAVGAANKYTPERGSDATTQSVIRAGNGVGFIEVDTYANVPENSAFAFYPFVITIDFTWTT